LGDEVFIEEERLNCTMVYYFTHDLIYHLIIFQAVILLIIVSNIWITRHIRHHSPPSAFPMVSILIPARNEERNIESCVQSILAQDYPSFEVLVLDDQSSDGTRTILERIAFSHPALKILYGESPSGNQAGKNWACSQLARQAQGELLLFTDADTLHRSDTLKIIVTTLMGEQADLLTGFPCQEVHTWGERLLVPFSSWAFLCFIPLALAYKLRLPFLSMAVGQMMLFRREAYLAVGGHESVGHSAVDDMSLARRIKAERLCWRVSYIVDLVSCRMYQSSQEAIEGFTKNLFAAFDYRLLPFLFAFLWLLVMFWIPLFVLAGMISGLVSQAHPVVLIICILLSLLIWFFPYFEMGIPFTLTFLYPFTILANVGVAFRSLAHSLGGRIIWKGRTIARAHWKWL
jgi:chlorobactene glucosyltransferase